MPPKRNRDANSVPVKLIRKYTQSVDHVGTMFATTTKSLCVLSANRFILKATICRLADVISFYVCATFTYCLYHVRNAAFGSTYEGNLMGFHET